MDKLLCYQMRPHALQLGAGRSSRTWMDNTNQRFAYRCLPLSMANSSGWEILCPCTFKAAWNGGSSVHDIQLTLLDDYPHYRDLAVSHFGGGILTFHTGWLFRTPPGWALQVSGAPNMPKHGIAPLTGIVETEWLPFTFTMNWLFTQPGEVTFEKGEPICFVMPVPHQQLHQIEPIAIRLPQNPELQKQVKQWTENRNEFITKLRMLDKPTIEQGWQRNYMRGETVDGTRTEAFHLSKRNMKKPRFATPEEIEQAIADTPVMK